MKVEEKDGKFIILGSRRYFSFFVDHDSSCWTKREYSARVYNSFREAQEDLEELKRRGKIKRSNNRSAKQ